MWRFLFSSVACGAAILMFSSGGAANVCPHTFTYKGKWVYNANVLGVGEGKCIMGTSCIEIHTDLSYQDYPGYHPTADGYWQPASWLNDCTTSCDNPAFTPRYEMHVEGEYDSDHEVLCRYCEGDID